MLRQILPSSRDGLAPGEISGNLMVFWVGEDRFIYYPHQADPLTYTYPRPPDGSPPRTIQPGVMYTDGGSIPQAVRGIAGFSPWSYGPAYVVHDWLYLAHRCVAAGAIGRLRPEDRAEALKAGDVSFAEAARLLAAVIAALAEAEVVPRRRFVPGIIFIAVYYLSARRNWDAREPGGCRPVSPEDLARIEASIVAGALNGEAAGPAPARLVHHQVLGRRRGDPP